MRGTPAIKNKDITDLKTNKALTFGSKCIHAKFHLLTSLIKT